MIKLVLFAAVSGALAYVSRASIADVRSHGFYRFLAWECIVVLILLNIDRWFRDPFSVHQLASWLLLAASILPGVSGICVLRAHGLPDPSQRHDDSLVGIEKTTRLVTTGPFRYPRHPLYSSLLLLAWGVFLKDPSMAGVSLALGATACLIATARVEERENLEYFGPDYEKYMRTTTKFIPFVF